MSKNYGYRFLGVYCLLGVLALSVAFIFFWPKAVSGNVAYWVMKSIALLLILIIIVEVILKKANFSKALPMLFNATLAQGLPALMRIGWVKNAHVPTALVVVDAILMFLVAGWFLLMAMSNNQFHDAENEAKHSSNYKG